MLLLNKEKIINDLIEKYPDIDDNLEKMILFGSVAKEQYNPNSDVDLLLITKDIKKSRKSLTDFKMKILLKYSVLVNSIYSIPNEFESEKEPIYNTIKKEGKVLWEKKKIEKK